MTKRQPRYTDEFRADAVLMLEAAGYTGNGDAIGALTAVSKRLKVPLSTLRRWFIASNNPPPAELVRDKRATLKELIEEEIRAIFHDMPSARPDAVYRDMGWVVGVLLDKHQLLDNKPTAIVKLQRAVEAGHITPQDIKERWPNIADRFFAEAGIVNAD